MAESMRPRLVVVVAGTGTEVGKTWVAAELARSLADRSRVVAVRKPAQSFEPGDAEAGITDADLLGAATGEDPTTVCPAHRRYATPMAPPVAAEVLGMPPVHIADLAGEVAGSWPGRAPDIGLVELAGGVRSPAAHDGDGVALTWAVDPDVVLLVADAGLGTINGVRLTVDALRSGSRTELTVIVHLNRFDGDEDLHRRNRQWLAERDGLAVTTDIAALAEAVLEQAPGFCVDCGAVDGTCAGGHDRFEAPRFCPVCGRRMAVIIVPTGHRSTCRTHGEPV